MLVLCALDAVEEAVLEVLVAAEADHAGRGVDGQTDQRAEDQHDFGQHQHAEQVVVGEAEVGLVVLVEVAVVGTYEEYVGVR